MIRSSPVRPDQTAGPSAGAPPAGQPADDPAKARFIARFTAYFLAALRHQPDIGTDIAGLARRAAIGHFDAGPGQDPDSCAELELFAMGWRD